MPRDAAVSARTHLVRVTIAAVTGLLLVAGGAGSAQAADPVRTHTTITCESPQTYTGRALTPCSATVTATDGMTWVVPVVYRNNVNAGTASVEAGLGFVPGYESSHGSSSFTIAKAHFSTVVTCPASVPYTGKAIEPCSAYAAYGDGQTSTLDVRYVNNVDPGKALAIASFLGDPNYVSDGGGSASFLIGSPTTVTVTCEPGQTYSGAPLTPCSAKATAPDGLDVSVPVTYSGNTDAGTATATAVYAGDASHLGATGTATFTIAKATASLSISCRSAVFTGDPLTPCLTSFGAVGTVTGKTSFVFTDNVHVGTATATFSYAGDANHLPASRTTTFAITPAPVVVTVSCPASVYFTGAAVTPCTAAVTGPGGLDTTAPVTYTDNTYAGTATATATYAGGGDYQGGTGTATFRVVGFTLKGYYAPVLTGPTTPVWNIARAGSTVPLKFEAFLPDGTEITSPTTLGATLTTTRIACTATPTVTPAPTDGPATPGATTVTYDTRSGQFVESWKTAKGVSGCFRVTTTMADHSQLTAYYILL